MAQLTEWLAPLIDHELRDVLTWKRGDSALNEDSFGRLGDDRSNFYCSVDQSLLPRNAGLQLIGVLSTSEDFAEVVVTDGATKVQARLFPDVIKTLESQMGEELSPDTLGDVFNVRSAVVVSTPMGPSPEHIRLWIRKADYRYHLRKLYKQATPVEDQENIRKLVDPGLASVRELQLLGEGELVDLTSGEDGPSRSDTNQAHSPVPSQRDKHSQTFVTQVQPPPSLGKDGFEIEQGLNLQRPTRLDVASQRTPSRPKDHPSATTEPGVLLGLLKRKAPDSCSKQSPRKKSLPTAPLPTVLQQTTAEPRTNTEQLQSRNARPNSPDVVADLPEKVITAATSRNERSELSGDQAIDLGCAEQPQSAAPKPLSVPPPRTPAQSNASYSRRARRIPTNQQRLLDQPSSWLPPLPGKVFPQPNVPVELLKRWNAAAKILPATQQPRSSKPKTVLSDRIVINSDDDGDRSSSTSSSETKDNDDLLPGWHSSPSLPERLALPPDSSANDRPDSSPVQPRNDMRAPPTLENPAKTGLRSSPVQSRNRVQPPSSSAMTSSPRAVRPASPHNVPGSPYQVQSNMDPPRETAYRHDSGRSLPSRPASRHSPQPTSQPPSPIHSLRDANSYRTPSRPRDPRQPSLTDRPPHFQSSSSSPRLFSERRPRLSAVTSTTPVMGPSPPRHHDQSRFKRPLYDSYRPPRRREESNRRRSSDLDRLRHMHGHARDTQSSPKSVVKATSVSDNEGDIKMGIPPTAGRPQSSEPDPAIAHRIARRQHFAESRRRKWLRENYHTSTERSTGYALILRQYRKAYPHDAITLADFAEAAKQCFPKIDDGMGLVALRPHLCDVPASSSVLDTLQPSHNETNAPAEAAEGHDGKSKRARADYALTVPGLSAESASPELSPPQSNKRRSLPWQLGRDTRFTVPARASLPSAALISTGALAMPSPPSQPQSFRYSPSRAASLRMSAAADQPSAAATASPVSAVQPASINSGSSPDRRTNGISGLSDNSANQVPVFRQFCDAWQRLRPSGAFALTEDETQRKRTRQLRVLSWDL